MEGWDWRALDADPRLHALFVGLGALALAWVIWFLAGGVFRRIASRTQTELDDLLLDRLRTPLAWSIALGGLGYAFGTLGLPDPLPFVTRGLVWSAIVVVWTVTGTSTVRLLLSRWTRHPARAGVMVHRVLPAYDIVGRTVLWGAAVYCLFLAWDIDLTAWLASAGIVGLAVGFAAQDSLANLVAGLVLLAEGPYKLGDWLTLDTGERGRVTEIGFRATRLLTPDDVEVIVPNKVLGGARIVNESGGPYERTRVAIDVSCAYGSDIDLVRAVLLSVAAASKLVDDQPAPKVVFREFGDSGLAFRLLVWAHPRDRFDVVDQLNCAVYKAFADERIEIPYPKRDVYVRQLP